MSTAQEHLHTFFQTVQSQLNATISKNSIDAYDEAVALILNAEQTRNRIHLTGIGKPSHIARYMASLLSSTGTKAYFLDGTEAVHGSCGQLEPNDVVICISNSGETEELKATVNAIKNNDCTIIAVTGNSDSWLSKQADATLLAKIEEEGGPLNRAPRISILVQTLILQGLSIVLQSKRNITPADYIKWHPGGTLGKLRDSEVERG